MKKLTDKEFKELKVLMSKDVLDYTFLNYGGFTSKINPANYNKKYREEVKEFADYYSISVGPVIYQITPGEYEPLITEAQNENFMKFIAKENKKPANVTYMKDLFNAYTYEVIIYSDYFEDLFDKNW